MKHRSVILFLLVVIAATVVEAGERVIVTLRTSRVPSTVQWFKPSPLIPDAVLRTKPQDNVMSASRQQAWLAMQRYVVVDVSAADLEMLRADPDVVSVDRIRRIALHEAVTNDSLSEQQWSLTTIGAPAAWKRATADGILVGVLDTGADWNHPDLVNRLAVRDEEDVNGNGTFEPWSSAVEVDGVTGDLDDIDNDGNGYVDDVIGYDFVDQETRNLGDDRDRDPIPFDEQGHGTSVAGVIAAEADNSIGIAGLARDAGIVTLRAFDATGNAEEDDIAAALIYAALNNVKVVNLSFGDGVDSPVMRDAVRFAAAYGCVLVASAGNSGTVSRQFPAGYDDVMAIAATNSSDARAPFSSTGSIVDLSAPGDQIITTAVGGRYRTVSGTSFAAPLVAATAAMMLEQDPSLTADEIRTMLSESSLDLGDNGWDPFFGAGRLQSDAALALVGKSIIEVDEPTNEQEIDLRIDTSFVVRGSVVATLFDSFVVYIGRGAEPATWSVVGGSSSMVKNEVLATIQRAGLQNGDHVVRLVVSLKDGRTLEHRKRVRLIVNDTLTITDVEVIAAWDDDRRAAIATITTSRPTQLRVIRTTTGAPRTDTLTDILRFTRTHSRVIPADLYGTTGSLRLECTADNGDTISVVRSFDLGSVAAPTTGWSSKTSAPFVGYVLDDVRDMYASGDKTFPMADLSSGTFGNMITVERSGLTWQERDTSADVWIPRGMGDANGNGRLEILGHVVGKAVLFEAATPGGDPFATVIYADTLARNNGAGMADVNGDGREDVLMLSDSGCVVLTWRNNRFERLGIAVNPTPPATGNATNRVDEISVAVGDLDGDGKTEVAFSDTDGDLVISEYNGTSFTTEYTHLAEGVGGSGYVVAADVDGDGRQEIVHGVPDDPNAGADREYGRQAWTYRMFRATAANTYEVSWTDHFTGVRYGIGYRNGWGAGDLDGQPGDEVAICVFPRLYVFSWKNGGMQPIWYKDDVVTPRFLTYDFDNNGTAELGYGVTVPEIGYMSGFTFSEYAVDASRLATPQGLRGTVVDNNTIMLSWMPVPDAAQYRVFRATADDGLFRAIDTVNVPTITIDTLQTTEAYRFRVSALPLSTSTLRESDRSTIIDIGIHPRIRPVRVEPDTITSEQIADGASVVLHFSGPMLQRDLEPSKIVLLNGSGEPISIALSVVFGSDSALAVRFAPSNVLRSIVSAQPLSIAVGELHDAIRVPTESAAVACTVEPSRDTSELILVRLDVVSASRVRLTFSEPVTESALTANAYTIVPSGAVASVSAVAADVVELQFDDAQPLSPLGVTYYLTASASIISTSGISMTKGAGNTLAFVLTAADLQDVFVYPHPVRLGVDDHVTFANLTLDADISILDQRFNEIARVRELDGNGGARWDLRTSDGVPVPPGMYFYRINGTNADGASAESGFRKLMIRR